jgi:hypothetical protein
VQVAIRRTDGKAGKGNGGIVQFAIRLVKSSEKVAFARAGGGDEGFPAAAPVSNGQ